MPDIQAIVDQIRRYDFHRTAVRPHLLFDAAELPQLRRRAAEQEGLLARLQEENGAGHRAQRNGKSWFFNHSTEGNRLLELDPNELKMAFWESGDEAVAAANAYLLTGNPALADWAAARVRALLRLDTWFAKVHVGHCRYCDHVMANVASDIALVHDFLGDYYSPAETQAIADGLRVHAFDPWMQATGADPVEWWFKRHMPSNWKIMTCGDAGLAMCGFVNYFEYGREMLARAAQAVLEIFDDIPPDGDWQEGISYWYGTLSYGLRFARALRRMTRGSVDLFAHPALRKGGDYAMYLTTPAGRVYNFNDCGPELDLPIRHSMAMLAAENQRGDWMRVVRMQPLDDLLLLACDDSSLPSAPAAKRTALFPAVGVASLRSGPEPTATFVGFKSGMSDVGHSHLDANSFVVEARGQALVVEEGIWPYAHHIGFFRSDGLRWNFDANAAIGHNTLLIDGEGQTYGPGHAGKISEVREEDGYSLVVGDATLAYPRMLTRFIRTVLLLHPDVIVVRDVVQCQGPRHAEWLLHYAGSIRDDGLTSIIENGGVRLAVTPFLPDRTNGWRHSDVSRTSRYVDPNRNTETPVTIRYRSFSPFRKSESFEFLFGMRVGGTGEADWRFTPGEAGAWMLEALAAGTRIVPEGDGLRVAATVQ